MIKIGLLTFHASHNNGSMLQALALQRILENRYGCETEIIDFSNAKQRNMYSIMPKADNYRRVIKNLIWMTNLKELTKQYEAFTTFSKKYFHLSERNYLTKDGMQGLDKVYDAFITGSDQVWNISCRDADDVYYLNFVHNAPKFAYAVSFGANNPFELDNGSGIHSAYLENFRKISVREQNAKKWIENAIGKDVPICLDPTMLLEQDEWEALVDVGAEPVITGQYIFYYCFSITEDVQQFLKWASSKTGLPVYFMEAKEWTLKSCWRNKIRLIKEYGPNIYINVVKYAEIFITTSFHGTAFATIYRKNFWYIRSRESENSKDDRAIFFMTQLNLTSRYKTISELRKLDLHETTNFSGIDHKIDKLRNESFAYIESIIEEIK